MSSARSCSLLASLALALGTLGPTACGGPLPGDASLPGDAPAPTAPHTVQRDTAGIKIDFDLKSGTTAQFAETIDGVPVTVTCSTFSFSGTTPDTGPIDMTLDNPPTIDGCTDSLGGTDTIRTSQADGSWKVVRGGTTGSETLTITVPQDGFTWSSSVVSGCSVTASPDGSTDLKGPWVSSGSRQGTDTLKNASLPQTGAGCTAGGTLQLSAILDGHPVS